MAIQTGDKLVWDDIVEVLTKINVARSHCKRTELVLEEGASDEIAQA